jgi:hypothetical protein
VDDRDLAGVAAPLLIAAKPGDLLAQELEEAVSVRAMS